MKHGERTAKKADEARDRWDKRVPAIFFRTATGREPVREWLKALPYPDDRKRIGEDIKTIEFGWPLGMPVSRPLGQGAMKCAAFSRTTG